jgi:hypothetical protein
MMSAAPDRTDQAYQTATDFWEAVNKALEAHCPEKGPCFKESMRDKLADGLRLVFAHITEPIIAQRDAALAEAAKWKRRYEEKEKPARVLGEIIEGERAKCGNAVQAIRAAITCRAWLRISRGSYEWDDDRWFAEFGHAIDEIEAELKKLEPIISDVSYCPEHSQEVTAALLRTILAEKEQDIATLRAQLAEAQKDTKRLDWIERYRPWVHNAASGYTESFGPKNPYWGIAPKDTETIYGDTFRAAIDAATSL